MITTLIHGWYPPFVVGISYSWKGSACYPWMKCCPARRKPGRWRSEPWDGTAARSCHSHGGTPKGWFKKWKILYWLVVGTCFIFPHVGNNHPNWLIFFRVVISVVVLLHQRVRKKVEHHSLSSGWQLIATWILQIKIGLMLMFKVG